MTKAPATITYASVVSRDTLRTALVFALLNNLKVMISDISNAHVPAAVTENMWNALGPEFGKDARKTAVIVTALYGLKSAGAAFKSHLARCMESLVYASCKASIDLELKPEIKIEDGVKFYS